MRLRPCSCWCCGAPARMSNYMRFGLCALCLPEFVRAKSRSAIAIRMAVKRGQLQPARAHVCTDCGKPACDYDHRDYGKPLEVEPVCRSCNRLRGPARPVLTLELP